MFTNQNPCFIATGFMSVKIAWIQAIVFKASAVLSARIVISVLTAITLFSQIIATTHFTYMIVVLVQIVSAA